MLNSTINCNSVQKSPDFRTEALLDSLYACTNDENYIIHKVKHYGM